MVCIKYRITKTNHIFHWRITTKLRLQSIGKNPSRQEKKAEQTANAGRKKPKRRPKYEEKKKKERKSERARHNGCFLGFLSKKYLRQISILGANE